MSQREAINAERPEQIHGVLVDGVTEKYCQRCLEIMRDDFADFESGKMQLVPIGIHNITTHNGEKTAGMWADASRA